MNDEMVHTIDLFLESKRLDRGAALNTISAYQRDLKQFKSFLAENKLTLNQVELTHLQQFISSLHKKKQSATSISRKMSTIRQFFKFCCLDRGFKTNPSEDLISPKKPQVLPRFLSPSQVQTLLEVFDTGLPYATSQITQALQMRDRTLVTLLYATGLRVSELTSLNIGDIDIKLSYVRVFGKGGKERIVPFAKPALELLYVYISEFRGLFKPKDQAVFLNHHGQRLSRQGFFLLLKSAAEKAQLTTPLSPHVLRHSFATHLLQGGIPLRSLQLLLGHSDLTTTQIYTHLQPEHLQAAIERFHPRAKLKTAKT